VCTGPLVLVGFCFKTYMCFEQDFGHSQKLFRNTSGLFSPQMSVSPVVGVFIVFLSVTPLKGRFIV